MNDNPANAEPQEEEVSLESQPSTPESGSDGSKEAELEAKIKELEDSYLRVHADFENTKKRLEREKFQALEYAYEKIAKDLLPIVDTLEIALKSANEVSGEESELQAKFKEGLELTLDNFSKVLQRHGIEVIACEGEFDPHLHECIMQVPSPSHQEGEIVQVFQKGYRYKERVLRPAMVSIAKSN
ncbi:MAG: nucleotide exchange factor GrpE [Wolinella succinogenes]|uniref:nucleotide exchange factor GrpE n=1 Tax=Wolinella succinogenes TaxID=844 RepID=UPI0016A809E9|nr:nucleotide exchange factor GrpE [Wolinella succinogenes]NLU33997.1 nucleotide exchange factor GrpE [Wolinella succinogenes]